jgi:8-oxo-dGTP pyrophosphatase MutT (NUDIX family)
MIAYTPESLRKAASARLLQSAPEGWNSSDEDMNERALLLPKGVRPSPASVLVPIVNRGGELTVLMTQRTASLTKHAGQVAFPGGRRDAGETALAAALREAEEETGLEAQFIEPLGFLDGYLTITNYLVSPVVALVHEGFSVRPQASEVDAIFEVPFSFLMDAANRETVARDWQGATRRYYAYPYKDRYIWGATAGMIKNLGDRLNGCDKDCHAERA